MTILESLAVQNSIVVLAPCEQCDGRGFYVVTHHERAKNGEWEPVPEPEMCPDCGGTGSLLLTEWAAVAAVESQPPLPRSTGQPGR